MIGHWSLLIHYILANEHSLCFLDGTADLDGLEYYSSLQPFAFGFSFYSDQDIAGVGREQGVILGRC